MSRKKSNKNDVNLEQRQKEAFLEKSGFSSMDEAFSELMENAEIIEETNIGFSMPFTESAENSNSIQDLGFISKYRGLYYVFSVDEFDWSIPKIFGNSQEAEKELQRLKEERYPPIEVSMDQLRNQLGQEQIANLNVEAITYTCCLRGMNIWYEGNLLVEHLYSFDIPYIRAALIEYLSEMETYDIFFSDISKTRKWNDNQRYYEGEVYFRGEWVPFRIHIRSKYQGRTRTVIGIIRESGEAPWMKLT